MNQEKSRLPYQIGRMLEALAHIASMTKTQSEKEFLEDSMCQAAVLHNLGVISRFGDSIKMRYPKLIADHPETPLKFIYQISNIIGLQQFEVSQKIVWNTIKNDFPKLQIWLQEILANLATSGYVIEDPQALIHAKFANGKGIIEILPNSSDTTILAMLKHAISISAGSPFLVVQERRIRPSDALNQHRDEIRDIIISHGASNPRVFGSVVRGNDTPDSDLNILVDPAPPQPWGYDGGMKDELIDLLGVKVDILTPDGLPDEIRNIVVIEAVPV
jgi:hypothetical protein